MATPKVIVITGSSDGIGRAAATQLHADGHQVVVVGRSAAKTQAAATAIEADYFVADFARLDDVRDLAVKLARAYPRIDVLANNAGGVFGDRTKTVDRFERTFQINHLAPFLLTTLLMDTLLASRASVLQTTTLHGGDVRQLDMDDLDLDRNYSPIRAYGASKLENVLFTKELHHRYHDKGLAAACFYPGNIRTNFGADTTSPLMKFLATNPLSRAVLLTTPEKGADQLVWLAEGTPNTDWTSGEFYVKRKTGAKLNPLALDANLARALWERSTQLSR